jgi:hypothetical protein
VFAAQAEFASPAAHTRMKHHVLADRKPPFIIVDLDYGPRVPIPTKPPPDSAIIAPPDSEMISPPWAGALLA